MFIPNGGWNSPIARLTVRGFANSLDARSERSRDSAVVDGGSVHSVDSAATLVPSKVKYQVGCTTRCNPRDPKSEELDRRRSPGGSGGRP